MQAGCPERMHGPCPAMGLEEVSDGIPRTDRRRVALQSELLQVCWAGLEGAARMLETALMPKTLRHQGGSKTQRLTF